MEEVPAGRGSALVSAVNAAAAGVPAFAERELLIAEEVFGDLDCKGFIFDDVPEDDDDAEESVTCNASSQGRSRVPPCKRNPY